MKREDASSNEQNVDDPAGGDTQILLLPSGAAIVWPPMECPGCKRMASFISCASGEAKCVSCAERPAAD